MASASPTRLKLIVDKRGVRRERLAADAKISVSYLRMLERGQYVPSLGIARRLASALDVTVDELFPPVATDLVAPSPAA